MEKFRINTILFIAAVAIISVGNVDYLRRIKVWFGLPAVRSLYLTVVFLLATNITAHSGVKVVADSVSRNPLSSASVFDCNGRFIGTSDIGGRLAFTSAADYPITVRYMGFVEKTVDDPECDTIFMQENVMQLPEVVVESRRKKLLHILAYVREYSTLATYTDTVSMFREKMVDFMMPDDDKVSFKGWTYPRVLNSKSYYHFTDANGLDSVSDRCSHHFTWADWIGMPPELALPQKLIGKESASDTVFGKYGPAQIWHRTGERLTLDVRFLADTASRKLIPRFSSFFHNDDIDFEQFGLRINYSNVFGSSAGPFELAGYSFNIESRGRGHDIFMFNHRDEPLFVTTYTEVYILDKEFVTVKEAKKWDKRNFGNASIDIYEPMEAPALQPSVLALIDRVNNIDADIVRQALPTDQRLVSRKVSKHNFNIANRALTLLKELTGISSYRSKKNFDRHWNDFTKDQIKKNQESRKQRSDE